MRADSRNLRIILNDVYDNNGIVNIYILGSIKIRRAIGLVV